MCLYIFIEGERRERNNNKEKKTSEKDGRNKFGEHTECRAFFRRIRNWSTAGGEDLYCFYGNVRRFLSSVGVFYLLFFPNPWAAVK